MFQTSSVEVTISIVAKLAESSGNTELQNTMDMLHKCITKYKSDSDEGFLDQAEFIQFMRTEHETVDKSLLAIADCVFIELEKSKHGSDEVFAAENVFTEVSAIYPFAAVESKSEPEVPQTQVSDNKNKVMSKVCYSLRNTELLICIPHVRHETVILMRKLI